MGFFDLYDLKIEKQGKICYNIYNFVKQRNNDMGRKITKPLSSIGYLMQEWDWEKNTLDPATLGFQSNQKVWWKCKYGHSWEAKISNRYNGRGCPVCRCRLKTSFQEQSFYYYIKKIFIDAINGYTEIFNNGMELDIFIPSLKMGIEYDGKAWHNEKSTQKEIRIGIVIGPEGGIDQEEINNLSNSGAQVVTLGKRILRTETVALNVLSILMYELENI